MKKHFLDKPILRDLFWFIVLPYRLKQEQAEKFKARSGHCINGCGLKVINLWTDALDRTKPVCGRVLNGEAVELLREDSGYVFLRNVKGETGWCLNCFIDPVER